MISVQGQVISITISYKDGLFTLIDVEVNDRNEISLLLICLSVLPYQLSMKTKFSPLQKLLCVTLGQTNDKCYHKRAVYGFACVCERKTKRKCKSKRDGGREREKRRKSKRGGGEGAEGCSEGRREGLETAGNANYHLNYYLH